MSAYDPRPGCPRCGEKEDLVFEAIPNGYGNVVTCLRCEWVGRENDLLTDAEARIEGKLHRMDL